MKLREVFEYVLSDALTANPQIEKFLDNEVIKEFGMSGEKPWISWLEFGTHKNVCYWYMVEGGYAIGHNESPSRGWSFPIKKLSMAQYEKYLNHKLTYDENHNIEKL